MRKILLAVLALCALPLIPASAQIGGGFPPTKNIVLSCTTACTLPASGIPVGKSAVIITGAGESRTSTVAFTQSTNLTWNGCGSCGGQVYVWQIQGQYSNSGGAGGISIKIGNSAPCNTGFNFASWGTLASGGSFITAIDMTPANAISATATGGTIYITGQSSGGPPTMVCWGQNVSNATATFITQGTSWFITRIS